MKKVYDEDIAYTGKPEKEKKRTLTALLFGWKINEEIEAEW